MTPDPKQNSSRDTDNRQRLTASLLTKITGPHVSKQMVSTDRPGEKRHVEYLGGTHAKKSACGRRVSPPSSYSCIVQGAAANVLFRLLAMCGHTMSGVDDSS